MYFRSKTGSPDNLKSPGCSQRAFKHTVRSSIWLVFILGSLLILSSCVSSGVFTRNDVKMVLERYPKSGLGPLHVVFRATIHVPETIYEQAQGCFVCTFYFEDYYRVETGCPPDPPPLKKGSIYTYECIETYTFRKKGTYNVLVNVRELKSGKTIVFGSIPVYVFSDQAIPEGGGFQMRDYRSLCGRTAALSDNR